MSFRTALFALLVIVTGFVSTTVHAQSAPVVWSGNGNSYQLLFANLTWTQARAAAENSMLDGRPGHLVTISSAAENNFVANLAGGDFRAWIGFSDTASEGNFQWVTGEPVTYTNWSGGEPNNSFGAEDYVEMFASNDRWNDRTNSPFSASNAAYIIEWEAAPEVTEFSIVVIPDTQMYAERHPEVFEAQIDWIVANEDAENIIYVAHLGDIKDSGICDAKAAINFGTGNGRSEWQIVSEAIADLDNANIPYGLAVGNHDFEQIPDNSPLGGRCPNFTNERPLDTYNTLFGPDRYIGDPHYGDPNASPPRPGNRVVNSNEDNFTLFEAGGVKFIAINLAYKEAANQSGVDPELDWADDLLKDYSDRIGIVTSHFFVWENPERSNTDPNDEENVLSSYGQEVYDRLSNNQNLFLMMSAHRWGEAWRVENTGRDASWPPTQILLADYQRYIFPFGDGDPNTPFEDPNPALLDFGNLDGSGSLGDSGLMRIMRFDTTTGMMNVETFIPPVMPIKGRPSTLVSTYFPASGDEMDKDTASNFGFTYLGYAVP